MGPSFLKLYFDFGVNSYFPHRIAQISKLELPICRPVYDDDAAAAPLHHLVNAEIFKMAAVGQIDVRAAFIGQAKSFSDQRLDGGTWPRFLPCRISRFTRITQPRAQACIE